MRELNGALNMENYKKQVLFRRKNRSVLIGQP